MGLLVPEEQEQVEAIAQLTYCNPFLGERIELERRILGPAFTPFFPLWHPRADVEDDNPNVLLIAQQANVWVERLRDRILGGVHVSSQDRQLYQGLCLYALYYGYQARFYDMIVKPQGRDGTQRASFFTEFRDELGRMTSPPGVGFPDDQTPQHLFACFFQVRRAFHHTFRAIAGGSLPAARLRAQLWQSIFTHDLRRYQRCLYERMGEITTLITGPSGAGKELVARGIGLSRYIPLDVKTLRFRESYEESFFALNLPALSPTLIESELFGHRRGSFTGAIADRRGWLDVCPPLGTVFLDEIGEIDTAIQVKLLRVLETRTFQPLGTTEERTFKGKVVAATNRNIGLEMGEGRFREDLYYRLCADRVTVPSLHDRLSDSPEELSTLLVFLAQRLVGESEAPALADEAERWIADNLGSDYDWPGNVRELSQCVSNVLIRRDYQPAARDRPAPAERRLADDVLGGRLTVDELLTAYCTLVYAQSGSYVAAAERLGLDRRTVRSRVDSKLLSALRDPEFR